MADMKAGAPLGASYTLVEQVGRGASGQVWRVDQAKKSQLLAAKILHPHLTEDTAVVERFVRERSVLLSLKHQHIVAVHDLVVEGQTLALVMDYCAGGSLRDLLHAQGTLAPAQALKLTATILETLAYAHGKNVIHRDIKPDNILFADRSTTASSDQLRITDFGIASLLKDGQQAHTTSFVGTPHYLPPELIQNGIAGPAGDVYSTGILLYELFSGRTPFAGEGTDFTVAYRHVSTTVPPLNLPEPIMQEVMGLLNKSPDLRPHPLDAAGRLRSLAERFSSLTPLEPTQNPKTFTEAERPKTIVRGSGYDTAPVLSPDFEEPATPSLGVAPLPTVIKPEAFQAKTPVTVEDQPSEDTKDHQKVHSKMIWLSLLCLVLLIATGWGIYWAVSSGSQSKEPLTAIGKQEQALPSGLSVRREATFTPSTSTITLKVVYAAQKAPLSGDILEVIPAVAENTTCPNASWEGADGQRNQPTVTDMTVECGWTLKGIHIKPNQEYEIQATVDAQVSSQKELENWLDQVSKRTETAITSADYQSTSYVTQRLKNIEVKVPERTVNQTVIPISLIPVWPSGEDLLNPIYSSETPGKPTGMLQSIAGDENPIRFSDGCSGHLVVDADGLKVTALSVADRCTVLARVGNFTDLQSDNFTITARE